MKFTSPKAIAAILALISSISMGLVVVFFPSAVDELGQWDVIIALGVVFLMMYFVSLTLIVRFITERIKPIYKTIQSLKIPEDKLQKNLTSRDVISDVNRDVVEWAAKKSEEINRLKELEGYRKEFLGNVSHELKTPIFNIQGYVLTLLDGALSDPSINRKYLERAEKSINRLISVVEDLESISKLESKVLKLETDKVNIVKLVNEVFEAHEMRAKDKGIRLMFDAEYDSPIWVLADKKRIFQALTNLVVNSINYGKKGGKTKVSFMDMSDNILIEVNDNGIGISKEDVPRIFERFYRVDKSRSREQGGTGLGLAIVKHIIEAHNQTVYVRSSLNEGTSFVFTLEKFRG
jgi:two-component system phosphate regulon sensor histidine kinase PhoR